MELIADWLDSPDDRSHELVIAALELLAQGLTQTQLAGLLQVSQNRVSVLERGQIEHTQIDTLRRYIDALGGQLRIEVDLGDERFQIA